MARPWRGVAVSMAVLRPNFAGMTAIMYAAGAVMGWRALSLKEINYSCTRFHVKNVPYYENDYVQEHISAFSAGKKHASMAG